MERTRLRELTPRCKNQQQPFQLPVEMERTRLRELTQHYYSSINSWSYCVEIERTRLRELTHYRFLWNSLKYVCRNGAYPIKGIDTRYSQKMPS